MIGLLKCPITTRQVNSEKQEYCQPITIEEIVIFMTSALTAGDESHSVV